jgi:hypothetical protein
LEGGLRRLVCTHDGLGRVTIVVGLQMDFPGRVGGVTLVEPGQLDAREAAADFLDDDAPFGS